MDKTAIYGNEKEIGALGEGFNSVLIGVCLVGVVHEDDLVPENNFTPEQFITLKSLLGFLSAKYPLAKIQGHRDFPNVKKACPSFDVGKWLAAQ